MNLKQFRWSFDWNQGTYNNAHLDTSVQVSNTYSHPSVVPGTSINHANDLAYVGTRVLEAAQGSVVLSETNRPTVMSTPNIYSGTPAWSHTDLYAITSTAGDSIQFTTTAQQVTLYLAGIISSGAAAGSGAFELKGDGTTVSSTLATGAQSGSGLVSGGIRNGCLVNIYVNGSLVGQVDLNGAALTPTIYGLTGSNVIKVAHSGSTNASPVSSITSVVGTSVSGPLSLTPLTHPTYTSAQWRVVAQTSGTSGTWKIQKNISGTWTDQVIGLAVGATDTTHVPGLSVTIPAGTNITAGDTAGFTTDTVMMAIEAVQFSFGSGSGAGTYTTPVLDAGSSSTQWFLAEWVQSSPLASAIFATGNTPTPDVSWQTSTLSDRLILSSSTLPDSLTQMGFLGLGKAQRGRYAQLSFTFTAATTQPFVRDMNIFYSVPETDPQIMGKIPMGYGCAPGPNGMALGQTLACHLAARRQAALDYIASFGVSSSIDQFLNGYGQDVKLVQYTGEPPQAYRARVLGSLTSSQTGGSAPYIKSMTALLVLGDATKSSQIGLTQSARSVTVTIPAPTLNTVSGQTEYSGLPGLPTGPGSLAQTIIQGFLQTVLQPVGASISVTFN